MNITIKASEIPEYYRKPRLIKPDEVLTVRGADRAGTGWLFWLDDEDGGAAGAVYGFELEEAARRRVLEQLLDFFDREEYG